MSGYITKCPYCNKLIRFDVGQCVYYKYGKHIVSIQHHKGCGNFITNFVDDISFFRYKFKETWFDGRPNIAYEYRYDICDTILQHLGGPKLPPEHELLTAVVEMLKNDQNLSYTVIAEHLRVLKEMIEIVVGQCNHKDIYAIPLTDKVKSRLRFDSVIFWD